MKFTILHRCAETEESAAPGVGIHQDKRVFLGYQKAEAFVLQGGLLVPVEAVRINFLPALGGTEWGVESCFKGKHQRRSHAPLASSLGAKAGQHLCPRC